MQFYASKNVGQFAPESLGQFDWIVHKKEEFQLNLMEKLDELGAERWELIAIEGMNEGSVFFRVSETVNVLFLFKRKISPKSNQ